MRVERRHGAVCRAPARASTATTRAARRSRSILRRATRPSASTRSSTRTRSSSASARSSSASSTSRPRCGCSSSTRSCCSSATPATPRRAGRAAAMGIEVPLYYRLNDRLTFDFELALDAVASSRNSIRPATRFRARSTTCSRPASRSQNPQGFYGSARLRYFGPRPLIEDGSVESDSSTVVNLGVRLQA